MIKYSIYIFALLVVRVCFSADVNVRIDAPSQVKQGDEFVVSIIISKGSVAGIGHIKQTLPSGFKNATAVTTQGSGFKYMPEINTLKFTWMYLPAEQEFAVSYKVTADISMPSVYVNIGGIFSCVINNQKEVYEIVPATIMVGKPIAPVGNTTTTITTSIQQKSAPLVTGKNTTSVSEVDKGDRHNDTVAATSSLETGAAGNKDEALPKPLTGTADLEIKNDVPVIEKGIVYRVQLGAYSKKTSFSVFKNTGEMIELIMEGGLYKYMCGSHSSIEDAVKQKEKLVKLGYTGAFVVAYKYNKRVPIR